MNILFICASNSVRSQMAEGWARHLGDETINVRSAGMQPFMVHPMAIHVMKEAGVDISRQRCRRVDDRVLSWADCIVTLTEVDKPINLNIPEHARHERWSIPNPDALVSDAVTQEEAYRRIRDKIKEQVERLLRAAGIR